MKIVNKPALDTYTNALWTVIAVTGNSKWASDFDIAPRSQEWLQWLQEAQEEIIKHRKESSPPEKGTVVIPGWKPNERLSVILGKAAAASKASAAAYEGRS